MIGYDFPSETARLSFSRDSLTKLEENQDSVQHGEKSP